MPAINVRLTDDELATIRRRADAEGRSIQTLAHDAIVTTTSQRDHKDRVQAAAAHVIAASQDLLKRLAEQ